MDDIYKFIKTECLKQIGATHDFKSEWNADRYLIQDKLFAMTGNDNHNRPILTLKLIPENGAFLRETYKDKIIPGYYMNKLHWNTILLENRLDPSLISQLIKESYTLILSSFSKKQQAIILSENPA